MSASPPSGIGSVACLQTQLQTNRAAQHGIEHHEPRWSEEKYQTGAHVRLLGGKVGARNLELENRCTGNRTVGSNPTLSAS